MNPQENDASKKKAEELVGKKNTAAVGQSAINRATKAVRDYLEYDFDCLLSDVNILTRMNQASIQRYMELTTSTNDMTRKLIDINNRFDSLRDALKKIDNFNNEIEQLEKKASEIDLLTRQLGY
ncbi:unnamed protein product [Heterobilharzia americana]|nr:unnamed protein product [Heterobilharzia americana]CAH8614117.1 unnamed protein product [Heterobilharzia americana]